MSLLRNGGALRRVLVGLVAAALAATSSVAIQSSPTSATNNPVAVIGQPDRASTGEDTRCPGANARFGSYEGLGPAGVAVDRYLRVYVTDYGGNRVLSWPSIYSMSSCQAADLVIGAGSTNGVRDLEGHPEAVAVDGNGNVFVSDTLLQIVRVFEHHNDGSYTLKNTFGTRGDAGNDSTHLHYPRGLAVNELGRLYVADDANQRILWFDHPLTDTVPSGVIDQASCAVKTLPTDASPQPCVGNGSPGEGGNVDLKGLAVIAKPTGAAPGSLFITNFTIGRVVRIDEPTSTTPTTATLKPSVLLGLTHPVDVAAAPGGVLYVSDLSFGGPGAVRVYKDSHNPAGQIAPDETITTDIGSTPLGLASNGFGLMIADADHFRVLANEASTPNAGFLRVTTDPPTNADIIVRDVPRDPWGLNWIELKAGSAQVCFGDVAGYEAPPCKTVQIAPGQSTEVTGTYTKTEFLRIETSPPVASTISVDGVDLNDWGAWAEVTPGVHTVCFGKVQGYTPPPCVQRTVAPNSHDTYIGVFTPNPAATGPTDPYFLLRVTTDPPVNARIVVDGKRRVSWGLEWLKLPPDIQSVCFGKALYMKGPQVCWVLNPTAGETININALYEPLGSLRVTTSPPVPASIIIDGEVANAYGAWSSRSAGTYDICFGRVAGFITPPCQNDVVVTGGDLTTVTGVFTPL